jgi:hypothetical protein
MFGSPTLYAASLVPVMIGVVAMVSAVERNIGFGEYLPGISLDDFTTWRYRGDVVVAAAVIVIGGLVFGLCARTLVWLEGLPRPTVGDHFRHCLALYVVSVILVFLLISSYENRYENQLAQDVSLGYGLGIVCLFTVCYAILINALVLVRQRRSDYTDSGGVD